MLLTGVIRSSHPKIGQSQTPNKKSQLHHKLIYFQNLLELVFTRICSNYFLPEISSFNLKKNIALGKK